MIELGGAALAELEATFQAGARAPLPRGVFRGRVLATLDTPGAQAPHQRLVNAAAFGWTPFGIDFDARCWWFFHPRAPLVGAIGRFVAPPAPVPSRWRPGAMVYALDYGVSRLPGVLRRHLYDELVPLGADAVLGLGGVNRERGRGDHFFFVLERG